MSRKMKTCVPITDTCTYKPYNALFAVFESAILSFLRGDFFKNRETRAQKYRDALRKNSKFCCFFIRHPRIKFDYLNIHD